MNYIQQYATANIDNVIIAINSDFELLPSVRTVVGARWLYLQMIALQLECTAIQRGKEDHDLIAMIRSKMIGEVFDNFNFTIRNLEIGQIRVPVPLMPGDIPPQPVAIQPAVTWRRFGELLHALGDEKSQHGALTTVITPGQKSTAEVNLYTQACMAEFQAQASFALAAQSQASFALAAQSQGGRGLQFRDSGRSSNFPRGPSTGFQSGASPWMNPYPPPQGNFMAPVPVAVFQSPRAPPGYQHQGPFYPRGQPAFDHSGRGRGQTRRVQPGRGQSARGAGAAMSYLPPQPPAPPRQPYFTGRGFQQQQQQQQPPPFRGQAYAPQGNWYPPPQYPQYQAFQAQEEPQGAAMEEPYQEMVYETEDYMAFAATAVDSSGDDQGTEFVDHNGHAYYHEE
jgi:hypothetical protein